MENQSILPEAGIRAQGSELGVHTVSQPQRWLEIPTGEKLCSEFLQLHFWRHSLSFGRLTFSSVEPQTLSSNEISCRNPVWEMGQDRANPTF